MVIETFKSLFGAKPAAIPEAPTAEQGPLGLGLGLAASIDLMRLRATQSTLAMPPMAETFVITGHGVVDLGDGSHLHRYYDDEHVMLQVLCEGGITNDCVREVMFFHPWDSVVPQSEREWSQWDGRGGKIGLASFSADGFTFERHWGDPVDDWIEPVQFTETVVTVEGVRNIHQKVVSYRRPITGGEDNESLLIAVERDLATSDRGVVTFMIGYDVAAVDVTPV